MYIEKKIILNNNFYYIILDVEYRKNEDGFSDLYMKNYKDSYWDDGDCSHLIKKIEDNYSDKKTKSYGNHTKFMGDIIYIYDRIPFLDGIKYSCLSKNTIISKDEIEKYIKDNNIKMNFNSSFKLYDERTWKV